MTPRKARVLRRSLAASVALSTIAMGVLMLAPGASAAPTYAVVNMTSESSSVHIIANSNAFPNFRTGALDNSYGYAHSHVDASPFSQGRASPVDTGPLVQDQVAENSCGLRDGLQQLEDALGAFVSCLQQPQYVDVRFPPEEKHPHECGTNGLNYAEAYARENYAFAQSTEGSTATAKPDTDLAPESTNQPCIQPTQPPVAVGSSGSSGDSNTSTGSSTPSVSVPSTSSQTPTTTTSTAPKLLPISSRTALTPWEAALHRLNVAMMAWRARYMTADDAARFPLVLADAKEPDGEDGVTAVSVSQFDPSTGVMTTTSDSRVARVSFGGGAIVLHGVHAHAVLTDDGSAPKLTFSTAIADATVNGVPVVIDQNGVSVNNSMIPGVADGVQQATDGLNAALAQSGWKINAEAPDIKKSLEQATLNASSVHVHFYQPPPPDQLQNLPQPPQPPPPIPALPLNVSGFPQQYADAYVGQVFVDLLAVKGVPLTGGPGGGGTLTNVGGATSQFVPGTPGTPGTPGSPGGSGGTTGVGHLLRIKPLYLLLLYFLWQSLVIGTVASLWWMRAGGQLT